MTGALGGQARLQVGGGHVTHYPCTVLLGTTVARVGAAAGARNSTTVSPKRRTSPSFNGLCSVIRAPFR